MTLSSASGLSFANIFSFLLIKREIMTSEMVACLSSVAQTCAVQSLLGALLLFLLGLALRGRSS
jgi:hypothetical protein